MDDRELKISKVIDRRPEGMPIDQPCELGYHCPVCQYETIWNASGDYDERLEWSEFKFFIWCSVCKKDWPSVICLPQDPESATDTFLAIIQNIKGK
jgi:hypothetical protein